MYSLLPRFIAKRLFVVYSLLTRAMTLGVRVILRNEQGHVLLIRHTYVKGWHLPGGGVERGETLKQAACKEVREETNIQVTSDLRHFHTYKNDVHTRFDHVALFVCDSWEIMDEWKPTAEVAEIGFFDPLDLPSETTQSTRKRLAEVLDAHPANEHW